MSKIDELWAQAAANPGMAIDIGELVMCDACDEDWTTRTETGGFIFSSMGVCPTCAVEFMARVIDAGELCHIRAACPDGASPSPTSCAPIAVTTTRSASARCHSSNNKGVHSERQIRSVGPH